MVKRNGTVRMDELHLGKKYGGGEEERRDGDGGECLKCFMHPSISTVTHLIVDKCGMK
jgi:hypothetical protein